ncbi:MAG: metallopeptidase family protein [Dehalococcoidia bacterium]|nr:metallopeptidase family protein [Dehalococcoidia bacterium]
MVRLSLREFERLVLKALDGLPPSIRQRMDNVDVVVEEWPRPDDLEEAGLDDRHDLFGLYQGIPLTERTHYDMALPDKITIFQRPIEAACATRADVVNEVRVTVIYEVAHHFGLSDAELEHTEYG